MKFYTDGSRIYLNKETPILGWAVVCNFGLVTCGSRVGGSNINAEMLAIHDCLLKIKRYKLRLLSNANDSSVEIVTDSKTSLQIINAYAKDPNAFDLASSENYRLAKAIAEITDWFRSAGFKVTFERVKGHEGSLGNNFADYAATNAASKLYESIKYSNG